MNPNLDATDVLELVRRKCEDAYARGWQEARQRILEAVGEPLGATDRPHQEIESVRNECVLPRARHKERDDLVLRAMQLADHGLTQKGIRELLARQGHEIASSSLGVILKRLEAARLLVKADRVYVPRRCPNDTNHSSEAEKGLALNSDPFSASEPTKEVQHGTALDETH